MSRVVVDPSKAIDHRMNKAPIPLYLLPGDYIFLHVEEPRVSGDIATDPDVPGHPDIFRRPCFTQEDYDNRRKYDGNT